MADIVTGTVSGQVDMTDIQTSLSDIRREANGLAATTVASAAATATDLSKQIDAIDDTLTAAIHTVSRDTIDLRAQVTAVGYQVRDGFYAAGKDAEINALKTQIEMAKQTTYLSDKIDGDGEKTRALIAGLNNTDLNRQLIERNALLSEARFDGRHWRDRADMGQYAALNTQLQAFASQLQDVKQGTVNFGTMSGNAGRNQATNNVA